MALTRPGTSADDPSLAAAGLIGRSDRLERSTTQTGADRQGARAAAEPGAEPGAEPTERWADAALAAALFSIDPHGLGGVLVRAGVGPVRDAWLDLLRGIWPADAPWRKLPTQSSDDRVLGGLDLTATLQQGRPVAQRGLLAEADGGMLLVPMAERLPRSTAAHLCAALDRGEVVAERDGITLQAVARCGVVALDESAADDEPTPSALRERLGLQIDLEGLALGDVRLSSQGRSNDPSIDGLHDRRVGRAEAELIADLRLAVDAARQRLGQVQLGADELQALVGAAAALGVDSLRAAWLACVAARAHAAWSGHDRVDSEDASAAVRLVLVPRATRMPSLESAPAPDDEPAAAAEPPPPQPAADAPAEPPPPPPPPPAAQAAEPANEAKPDPGPQNEQPPDDAEPAPTEPLDERLLAAAIAAMPPGLLARLAVAASLAGGGRGAGRAGATRVGLRRGRPAGVRRALPARGARLSLIDTLRAAAPWQRVRAAALQPTPPASGDGHARAAPSAARRVLVRPEDLHIRRYQQRSETTTVFLVDASGSAALHRLAEAKGAVELLLADCYVRRDSVALVAFRGTTAELLLPPTRSLVRAKRTLAGLPGGGGTPLAAGLDAAFAVADAVRRRGDLPLLVLLTDGRANITRNGEPGREQAELDAHQSARRWRASGLVSLLVDTSAKPHPAAHRLAAEMNAVYLPLPHADASRLSGAVIGALGGLRDAA